jgi:hypothetical protein
MFKRYLNIYKLKVSQMVKRYAHIHDVRNHISFRNFQFENHSDIGLCTDKRTHIHAVRTTYAISFTNVQFQSIVT